MLGVAVVRDEQRQPGTPLVVGGARGVIAEHFRAIPNQRRRIAQPRVGVGEDRRHDLGVEGAAELEARDEVWTSVPAGSSFIVDRHHRLVVLVLHTFQTYPPSANALRRMIARWPSRGFGCCARYCSAFSPKMKPSTRSASGTDGKANAVLTTSTRLNPCDSYQRQVW